MSAVRAVLSALKASAASGLAAITGVVWGDITATSPAANNTNANQTITFTGGGSRTLQASFAMMGTLEYSKNSGAFTSIANFGTVSVATGDTLRWRYTPNGAADELAVVNIQDVTRGSALDSFNVQAVGYAGAFIGGGPIGVVQDLYPSNGYTRSNSLTVLSSFTLTLSAGTGSKWLVSINGGAGQSVAGSYAVNAGETIALLFRSSGYGDEDTCALLRNGAAFDTCFGQTFGYDYGLL
jgi:hypothetical protein